MKKPSKIYIYGRHSLYEALENAPRSIKTLYLADAKKEAKLVSLADKANVLVKQLGTKESASVGKDSAHQGVIGVLNSDALFASLEEFLGSLDITKNPGVAVCAEIGDPHNLGAIVRSAAALGLSGVIIPGKKQVPITAAVVKTSVGMVFRVPLIKVNSIKETLRTLKEKSFKIYGLDMKGEKLTVTKFTGPSAFVLGNEGFGVPDNIKNSCDTTLSIPMHKRAESLNVAASAAIVFYEWSRQNTSFISLTNK